MGGYPWAPTLDGGFTVLELPSRDEAIACGVRDRQGLSAATENCASSGSTRSPKGRH